MTNFHNPRDAQKYEIATSKTYRSLNEDFTSPRNPKMGFGDLEHLAGTRNGVEPTTAFTVTGVHPTKGDIREQVLPSSPTGTDIAPINRVRRAIWIVHGMGQQVPFETVDSLTQGLLDIVKDPAYPYSLPAQSRPRLRTVQIGDQTLQRVELDVDKVCEADKIESFELHLYESYWAPKTEGVAKLTDVVSFLWDGGLRGLLNYVTRFHRAMFGGMETFFIRITTPLWLCTALAVLLAMTVINSVILASAAASGGLSFAFSAILKTNWDHLTAIASCMVAVACSLGTVLFLATLGKPQQLKKTASHIIPLVCWIATATTVVQILATAVLMMAITQFRGSTAEGPFHQIAECIDHFLDTMPVQLLQLFATVTILVSGCLVVLAMITRAVFQSAEKALKDNSVLLGLCILGAVLNVVAIAGPWLIYCGYRVPGRLPVFLYFLQSPLWVWPFLVGFSKKVRELLVQYVGDVAIYVRSNKLDRFDRVRSKIKEAARAVASSVFAACEQDSVDFLYDRVAVVGHSLGSVIAYDTLNRLMLDDSLSSNPLDVAQRTKVFVTFGSPLNKTAFLFTIQAKDSLHIRERLACAVQPLITDYARFRKLNWINIYSPHDIISGKLRFYDLPVLQQAGAQAVFPENPITNVIDADAAVPLVAHVAYWKNKTVWRNLLAQITS